MRPPCDHRGDAQGGHAANIAALMACLAVAGCGSLRGRPPEEPAYRPVALIGGVEVRQYDARIAAETLVDGDAVAARGIGYRRLADYVGGANRDGRKLAMTVPLAQAAEGPGHWRIRLFLPAGATLAALPPPSDPAVALGPAAAGRRSRCCASPAPRAPRRWRSRPATWCRRWRAARGGRPARRLPARLASGGGRGGGGGKGTGEADIDGRRFSRLHNAMWPGLVGKGPDSEPPIDLDTMLDLTAAAEVDGVKFDGVDLFPRRPAHRHRLRRRRSEAPGRESRRHRAWWSARWSRRSGRRPAAARPWATTTSATASSTRSQRLAASARSCAIWAFGRTASSASIPPPASGLGQGSGRQHQAIAETFREACDVAEDYRRAAGRRRRNLLGRHA